MHFSWNLTQIFLGVPVLGKQQPAYSLVGDLFSSTQDNVINGGSYGPERSVVAIVAQVLLLGSMWVFLRKRKGQH